MSIVKGVHCNRRPSFQPRIYSLCTQKKGYSWVSQHPPVLQNQSQRRSWWNRDNLLAYSQQAPPRVPPPDRLSSIRQAPLSLRFCDAVGWNLQLTVHLPVTFYTSLVTELLFFLGCLDNLVKGHCERVAFSHLLVCSQRNTDWSFMSRLDSFKTYFKCKRGWKILAVGIAAGGMQWSRLHVNMLR